MTEPTKPPTPLAVGGMSREGTTTIVKIYPPDIEPQDKKVLCMALCQCDKTPQVGKDGQQLKQICVAKTMKEVDKQLEYKSPYKQEINYDMTKSPPEPIMDKDVPTKGHDWLPGFIEKHWPSKPYTPGAGLIRRPDVVIVKDPGKVTEAYILGTPVEALCGHVFTPSKDPKQLPVCDTCKDIADIRTDGRGGEIQQDRTADGMLAAHSPTLPAGRKPRLKMTRSWVVAQWPAASDVFTSPAWNRPRAPLPTLANLWVTIG